ncbi:MAG: DUF1801 domain-containing protein [Candidatus Bathyarchaeota archaeon]|nr:DUF1801 domain-containing protein [Candidatus Termiticorpusculum sp.]
MGNNKKRTLEEVLESLDETQRQTTQKIQSLIQSIIPEATEIIRRGNITYVLDGKDFVWLTHANGHVDVEFALGVSLDSMFLKSHGIKEKNKCVQHVEVNNFEKYQSEITRLLHDAKRIWLKQYPETPA